MEIIQVTYETYKDKVYEVTKEPIGDDMYIESRKELKINR